jgi:16S rRNA (guanine527-N7)-methyltransferase
LPEQPTLSPDVVTKLDVFEGLLLRWNARINLVAASDVETLRQRHIADSLQLLPLLPPGDGPIGDLGTGGGFPGLILAIASGRTAHLVESDRRKAAFLLEAAGRLGLSQIRIHATRIEQVALPPLAAITARALAPLTDLLPAAARLLAPGGIAIFPKGRTAEEELTQAAPFWTFTLARYQSRTEPAATILRLGNIHRASQAD